MFKGKNGRNPKLVLLSHTPHCPESPEKQHAAPTWFPTLRRREAAGAGAASPQLRGARPAASRARRLPRVPPRASRCPLGAGVGGAVAAAPGARRRCCCCRGRCRGIRPSAQPLWGFGARAGAQQAAARATGRERQPTLSPYLGLSRRLRTWQPPLRTWGGRARRDRGEEGCLPEFPQFLI